MSKEQILKHTTTGIWVFIFALIPLIVLMVVGGALTTALLSNPVLLMVVGLAYLFLTITISGWASRMGVRKVP